MLINGNDLNQTQRAQVLAVFIYRHHAIGAGLYYATERAWLTDHAFHFIKSGARLALNKRYAECPTTTAASRRKGN